MKAKRILSFLLAVILSLGIGMPCVLASDEGGGESVDPTLTETISAPPPAIEDSGTTSPDAENDPPEAVPPAVDASPDGEVPPPEEVPPEAESSSAPTETAAPSDEEEQPPEEPADQEAAPAPEETDMPVETEAPAADAEPESEPLYDTSYLPDPIPGYDPLDPSNPYPYGEPVDNFYPPEFDMDDSNGIMLMSQGSIPDSMWDNSILRALEYTGFDVQKLKDNNWLYKYEYISTNLPSHDSSILSDIGYGEYPNGDETVSDPSTPTGKAPNIPYFESNGLVCASFVNYYVNNYLRNIEGVDTSAISSALSKVGTSVRVVSTWVSALTTLSSDPSSGVTRYTSADTAYANLVPGDIIAFKNDSGTWMHLAVYAGTYTLYRTSGGSLGTYHFIIHVGNSRGPEISTAEYMANSGAKASKPAEWYHLNIDTQEGDLKIIKTSDDGVVSGINFTVSGTDFNQTVTTGYDGTITVQGLKPGVYTVTESVPSGYSADRVSQTVTVQNNQTATVTFHNSRKTGSVQIVKSSDDGKVSGIYFTVVGGNVNQRVQSGPDGTITVPGLIPGVYTVTEEVPEGYICSSPSQSVTVQYDQTATVYFENRLKTGDLKIVKQSDDGVVSGITFRVQNGRIDQRVQSGSDGTITVPGLVPGNYTVTEEVPEGYICDDPTQIVQVQYDQTAVVVFQNKLKTGDLKIVKQSDDGVVSGITFHVQGGKIDQTVKSGTDGTITVPGLIPGSYEVTEEVSENYVCDNPKQTVQVEYNKTATVTFNNVLKKWKATVTKVDSEGVTKRGGGATLEGAVYGLYRNGELQATYTTDANGQFTTDSYACGEGWTIQEREPPTGYTLDPTVYEVGAEPGDFTIASNALEMTVTERIIKAKLQILKQDKYTLEPLAGASFRVYDENDSVVAEGTTGEDGTFITEELPYMHYRWQEYEAPEGYQLDDTMHEFSVDTDAVIIEAVQDDLRIPGSITIHKTDTKGANLSGAMYLLEYSTGGAWQPVTYREGDNVTEGGCTSQGLTDGQLTSGSDGIVTFTGLRADKSIQYRLTETRAPAGTSLLKDPVYVGTLPAAGETGDEYEYDISFSIVNNKVTTLPQTGGTGLLLPVAAGIALTGMAMCAGIYFITKKSKENYL